MLDRTMYVCELFQLILVVVLLLVCNRSNISLPLKKFHIVQVCSWGEASPQGWNDLDREWFQIWLLGAIWKSLCAQAPLWPLWATWAEQSSNQRPG